MNENIHNHSAEDCLLSLPEIYLKDFKRNFSRNRFLSKKINYMCIRDVVFSESKLCLALAFGHYMPKSD